MARDEQRAPNAPSLADQLAEERRKVIQLSADNQRLQKTISELQAKADSAERDARSMAEDLRKASSGVLLDIGGNGCQLKESLTTTSGLVMVSIVDGKEVETKASISPQRGDVLCAGDDGEAEKLQAKFGRKARVYRVTPAVLSDIVAAGLVE